VNLNLVVYVFSIKRMSILFSVVGAYILFKEKNTSQRILATIIILVGIFFIAFFN
jgi:drug/metabolite transporter (DMT)-like permease